MLVIVNLIFLSKLKKKLTFSCSVSVSQFVFGGEMPTKIVAGGHLNEDGIDKSISATLLYSGKGLFE